MSKRSYILAILLLLQGAYPAIAAVPAFCDINHELSLLNSYSQQVSPHVLKLALKAYNCALGQGIVQKQNIFTIIDYSLPSSEKRLWVIDVTHGRVLFHTLVAHGSGSGELEATHFSDTPETHESSLGLFLTGATYFGHDGYSLKIKGLSPGFNDKAEGREIVIHGANYVSEDFVRRTGYLGRSWGCPALPKDMVEPVVNTIKDGTLVFAYYPDPQWLQQSIYLHCTVGKAGMMLGSERPNLLLRLKHHLDKWLYKPSK